jgi:hypothetical protein
MLTTTISRTVRAHLLSEMNYQRDHRAFENRARTPTVGLGTRILALFLRFLLNTNRIGEISYHARNCVFGTARTDRSTYRARSVRELRTHRRPAVRQRRGSPTLLGLSVSTDMRRECSEYRFVRVASDSQG